MSLSIRNLLSGIDAKFALGLCGLAVALAGSVEAGRAYSAAQALRAALDDAGRAALASLEDAEDEASIADAALASFKESKIGATSAVLASVSVDQSKGALVLEGTVPIEIKVLAPLGLAKMEIGRRLETKLK